jgi:amidase
MRTTAGAAVLADHVAAADAPVVERLRAAGAVIIGKANLTELAGAVTRTPGVSAVGGRTRNPYGDAFTPGGSSSGSAAGVAAGLCTVSVGTETSGPPGPCGVQRRGRQNPAGLVPTDGIVPWSQPGLGRADRPPRRRCLAALRRARRRCLPAELSPIARRAGRRVAADILSQQTPFETTSDNAAVLDRITDGLATAGATIVDATFADAVAVKQFEAAFTKFVLGGLVHDTMPALAAAGAPVSTATDLVAFNLQSPRTRMPAGELVLTMACVLAPDAATYRQAARDNTEAAAAILDAALDAAGTDLLVSITNRHSSLYATAGYPAITVPVGLRANGMPTGVTFIGRPGTDARLLARAFAFEQATQLRVGPTDPHRGGEVAR